MEFAQVKGRELHSLCSVHGETSRNSDISYHWPKAPFFTLSSCNRYWRGKRTRANLSEYVVELGGLSIERFCLFFLIQISESFGKSAVKVNCVHALGVNFNMHVMFKNVSRKD